MPMSIFNATSVKLVICNVDAQVLPGSKAELGHKGWLSNPNRAPNHKESTMHSVFTQERLHWTCDNVTILDY